MKPYDGVDIVHDMNDPLPFEDNSVHFVIASHSLQYVVDLDTVMREIYRICKHTAIVCIIAPYAHVSAHMVNPRYKQYFNEHSPRYWTTDHLKHIRMEEPLLSWSPDTWSLADMSSDIAPLDLRLIRMEFFYFPEYGAYDDLELGLLRQSQMNVAYQIMYHLMVIKKPTSKELIESRNAWVLEEPSFVKEQRQAFAKERHVEKWVQTEHLSPLIEAMEEDNSVASSDPQPDDHIRKHTVKNSSTMSYPKVIKHQKGSRRTREPRPGIASKKNVMTKSSHTQKKKPGKK